MKLKVSIGKHELFDSAHCYVESSGKEGNPQEQAWHQGVAHYASQLKNLVAIQTLSADNIWGWNTS